MKIITDNYGDAVYRCHYTNKLVLVDDVLWTGAHVPGVNASYAMENSQVAKEIRKQSGIDFHEYDANCNTCAHLERIQHVKCKYGFLKGKCKNPINLQSHPYKTNGNEILFHPSDWMGMSCYLSRWEVTK